MAYESESEDYYDDEDDDVVDDDKGGDEFDFGSGNDNQYYDTDEIDDDDARSAYHVEDDDDDVDVDDDDYASFDVSSSSDYEEGGDDRVGIDENDHPNNSRDNDDDSWAMKVAKDKKSKPGINTGSGGIAITARKARAAKEEKGTKAKSGKKDTSSSNDKVATKAASCSTKTNRKEKIAGIANEEGGKIATSRDPPPKKTKTIEQTYQKKTQLEHILLRPDTYIGSTETVTQPMFVYDASTKRIRQREVTYTPGLYKIFDEIVVNAADNKQRDPNMDRLEVDIDANTNTVSVLNNGNGIPIVMHGEHDCYVPTLIFGQLLTGSNFDDDERKTTGGRNGYGAKLANIFSTEFVVECLDSRRGLLFRQAFRNNMHETCEPSIEKCSKAEAKRGDHTKITFRPDLKRFGMSIMDDDIIGLLSKRAYDIAGSMANKEGKKLRVFLNGNKVPVRDFKSYLELYDGITPPAAFERIDDRWEVGVGVSDGSFQQISFVNAIATTKGGGHVNYVADLIAKKLQAIVKKKNKGEAEMIKINQIKNHLAIFVNCLVENPTFDSQTKESMTIKPSTFAKSVKLSDKFMKVIEKSGVIDSIMSYAKFKQNQALKRMGGTKKTRLTGITKLDDANNAGTARSRDCTLIITEGDSAKSLAVSGLSVVGRDYYGVFPLKGKLLNVRDATHAQIMKNEEIMNLVEIMGFKFNNMYTKENIKTLRYGHLMIMADQDHDGSHIKGLIINFIHHFWPSLLDVPGFLQQFITPIVKCTKGKKSETFFTLPEYETWKESIGNTKGWNIKYYKGLGTSTSSEAKEYFSNLDIHQIHFNEISTDNVKSLDGDMIGEESADKIDTGASLIEMAFSKSKVEARKRWLSRVKKDTFLDYGKCQRINYSDFINRELVLFSQHDNVRSIPHLFDGFKPSQRKVLFACFKKKLNTEIKVAQLAGYIGEHSAYHHGEASLHGAIIGMAQTFCGSNNVNLLYPSGQFGTRRMGGKDHASARYIFTRLEKIARAIFHPDDDPLLNYLNEDGLSIEPEYYMPVIPMVLVNGCDGIGTGWSCTIQNYNPREIIENIRKLINGEEPVELHPYFCGYKGEIMIDGKREGRYIAKGKIERINETAMLITELPLGKWTQDYKSFLEGMMTGTDKSPSKITNFKENHTDTTVSFTVNASKEMIDSFEEEKEGLYRLFKLSTTISTKNMVAFDKAGNIKTYSPLEIFKEFYRQRKVFYIARKDMLLHKKRAELSILENKARFVKEVCRGDLVVTNRKKHELLGDLVERGYVISTDDADGVGEESDILNDETPDIKLAKGFEYLLGMKIWSLTSERVEEICRQMVEKAEEVKLLEATSPEKFWLDDLDAIEKLLDERDKTMGIEEKTQKCNRLKAYQSSAKKRSKSNQHEDEWDSEQSESESDQESESLSDSEASTGIDSFKGISKNYIAPAKKLVIPTKEMPASKKARIEVNAESRSSTGGKGWPRIPDEKARASTGKTAVSLSSLTRYPFKATKEECEVSVLSDSRGVAVDIAGRERKDPSETQRRGHLTKNKFKRELDEYKTDDSKPAKKSKVSHETTNLIHAKSFSRRRLGDAKPNYAEDDTCTSGHSSESDIDVEDDIY